MAIQWVQLEHFLGSVNEEFPEFCLVRPDSLASAMHAVQSAWRYAGETDPFVLGACYAERIARSHSFADGNKRCGLLACLGFLAINDIVVQAEPYALADAVVSLACRDWNVENFATFLKNNRVV